MKDMYSWIRPKIAIPVHGEHRHLKEHYDFAKLKELNTQH